MAWLLNKYLDLNVPVRLIGRIKFVIPFRLLRNKLLMNHLSLKGQKFNSFYLFGHSRPLFFLNSVVWTQLIVNKNADGLIRTLVSKVTALPTAPQPLPNNQKTLTNDIDYILKVKQASLPNHRPTFFKCSLRHLNRSASVRRDKMSLSSLLLRSGTPSLHRDRSIDVPTEYLYAIWPDKYRRDFSITSYRIVQVSSNLDLMNG